MTEINSSRMKVDVLEECGWSPALLGVGLSHGLTAEVSYLSFLEDDELYDRITQVAGRLADKDKGHNKFLESIQVWLDVDAPRYWWQQCDTYRVGMTKQSESTMHTITRRLLTQEDFNRDINPVTLSKLNDWIKLAKDFPYRKAYFFDKLKEEMPEGFLQRRVINTNYKVLRHVYQQRLTHKLPAWKTFIQNVLSGVMAPNFITSTKGNTQ